MRKSCKFPEDCGGGARGLCAKCTNPVYLAAAGERLRVAARVKTEGQRALASDLMRRLNADPEFKEVARQRAKAQHLDPVFVEKRNAGIRAAADRRRGYALPPELVKTVAKWKRQGLTPGQIKAAVERIARNPDMR